MKKCLLLVFGILICVYVYANNEEPVEISPDQTNKITIELTKFDDLTFRVVGIENITESTEYKFYFDATNIDGNYLKKFSYIDEKKTIDKKFIIEKKVGCIEENNKPIYFNDDYFIDITIDPTCLQQEITFSFHSSEGERTLSILLGKKLEMKEGGLEIRDATDTTTSLPISIHPTVKEEGTWTKSYWIKNNYEEPVKIFFHKNQRKSNFNFGNFGFSSNLKNDTLIQPNSSFELKITFEAKRLIYYNTLSKEEKTNEFGSLELQKLKNDALTFFKSKDVALTKIANNLNEDLIEFKLNATITKKTNYFLWGLIALGIVIIVISIIVFIKKRKKQKAYRALFEEFKSYLSVSDRTFPEIKKGNDYTDFISKMTILRNTLYTKQKREKSKRKISSDTTTNILSKEEVREFRNQLFLDIPEYIVGKEEEKENIRKKYQKITGLKNDIELLSIESKKLPLILQHLKEIDGWLNRGKELKKIRENIKNPSEEDKIFMKISQEIENKKYSAEYIPLVTNKIKEILKKNSDKGINQKTTGDNIKDNQAKQEEIQQEEELKKQKKSLQTNQKQIIERFVSDIESGKLYEHPEVQQRIKKLTVSKSTGSVQTDKLEKQIVEAFIAAIELGDLSAYGYARNRIGKLIDSTLSQKGGAEKDIVQNFLNALKTNDLKKYNYLSSTELDDLPVTKKNKEKILEDFIDVTDGLEKERDTDQYIKRKIGSYSMSLKERVKTLLEDLQVATLARQSFGTANINSLSKASNTFHTAALEQRLLAALFKPLKGKIAKDTVLKTLKRDESKLEKQVTNIVEKFKQKSVEELEQHYKEKTGKLEKDYQEELKTAKLEWEKQIKNLRNQYKNFGEIDNILKIAVEGLPSFGKKNNIEELKVKLKYLNQLHILEKDKPIWIYQFEAVLTEYIEATSQLITKMNQNSHFTDFVEQIRLDRGGRMALVNLRRSIISSNWIKEQTASKELNDLSKELFFKKVIKPYFIPYFNYLAALHAYTQIDAEPWKSDIKNADLDVDLITKLYKNVEDYLSDIDYQLVPICLTKDAFNENIHKRGVTSNLRIFFRITKYHRYSNQVDVNVIYDMTEVGYKQKGTGEVIKKAVVFAQ